MLVLERHAGQSLTIGNSITITILNVKNGVARVGISAPKSMKILREEIQDWDMPKKSREQISKTYHVSQ